MVASKIRNIGLALLFAAGLSSLAYAQLDDPCSPFYGCPNDMQFFEPVDLDLDCQGCCQQCGFFFSYDKLVWATTGPRVEIGDPDVVQQMYRLFSAIPLDPITGQQINPPLLTNSIQNAVPRADFHLGDRYDFGFWHEDGNGWLMSVLDGPDTVQSFSIGLNGGMQDVSGQDGLALPLGDVFVSFRTDPGALAGFIDLNDPVIGGGEILGNEDGDTGILTGDGFDDDINQNGQHGIDGFDLDGDGQPDTFIIGAPPDYGDLVTLVTAFGQVDIRNTTKFNGFEVMRAHRLDNSHFKVQHQNNRFEWQYGARFLQFEDRFLMNGFGGLSLGDMQVDQQIENNIVGPQVGYTWLSSKGRWTLNSTGKFLWGLNARDWKQTGFVAEDATPTRFNHPLYLRPKSFSYGRADEGFSPVAELRVNLNYRLTDNVKLHMGYTGMYADNLRRASNHVDWVLFENGDVMGFRDVDSSDQIFTQGANFGIEVTQ